MGMHKELEHKLCKELDLLEEKYKGNVELTETDLKRMDLIYHTLKSMVCYEKEKYPEEFYQDNPQMDMSGRRMGMRGYSYDMGAGGYAEPVRYYGRYMYQPERGDYYR